jgi:hypothetical protein
MERSFAGFGDRQDIDAPKHGAVAGGLARFAVGFFLLTIA